MNLSQSQPKLEAVAVAQKGTNAQILIFWKFW
jgi:hypothetical protein